MKIGIVGSEENKWDERQKIIAKKWINTILTEALKGFSIVPKQRQSKLLNEWIREFPELPYEMRLDGRLSSTELPKLRMVSGHCPVGKELWYDITHDHWASDTQNIEFFGLDSPLTIESVRGNTTYIKVYSRGGVDTWSEIRAHQLGIKTEIFPPEICSDGKFHWKDRIEYCICGDKRCDDVYRRKGFRSRNIEIANSDVVYVLAPYRYYPSCSHHDKTIERSRYHANNGGCWTAKYAKKLGKEAFLIVVK